MNENRRAVFQSEEGQKDDISGGRRMATEFRGAGGRVIPATNFSGPRLRRKNVQSVTGNKWVDEFDKNLLLRCNKICIINQNQLCQVPHCMTVREVGWSNSIN